MKYKYHEISEILPMMSGDELQELANDIQENGQLFPIYLFETEILDGRNRYEACLLAGVEPGFREFVGSIEEAITFVISANIPRRHLTTSQRAMVAANIANLGHGGNNKKGSKKQEALMPLAPISTEKSAEKMNVSERIVKQAKVIKNEGTETDIKNVIEGKKTVGAIVAKIAERKEKKEVHKDVTGYSIPAPIWEDYKHANDIGSEIIGLGRKIRNMLEKGIGNEMAFKEINITVLSESRNLIGSLKQIVPHAVCPTCSGYARDNCTTCRKRGFISKFMYESAIPMEIKEIRQKSIQ